MNEANKRPTLFERLQTGLVEGVRFAQGDLTLQTAQVPARPPALRPRDIVRLRQRCNLSQEVFARMLNVSLKTVQNWEQGERKPAQAALRLLQIVSEQPDVVCQLVGIRGSQPAAGSTAREKGITDSVS